jgi:alanyl-tRNA synthetase
VQVPPLGEAIDLAAAREVRDVWAGVVRLSNTRGADATAVAEDILGRLPGSGLTGLLSAYAALLGQNREDERRLEKKKSSDLGSQVGGLLDGAKDLGGVKLVAAELDGVDGKALRGVADQLRDQLGSGVLALVSKSAGKAALLVAVTDDLTGRFKAGDLVKELAPIIGGRGGGKPNLAQAGGNAPEKAGELFARLEALIGGG